MIMIQLSPSPWALPIHPQSISPLGRASREMMRTKRGEGTPNIATCLFCRQTQTQVQHKKVWRTQMNTKEEKDLVYFCLRYFAFFNSYAQRINISVQLGIFLSFLLVRCFRQWLQLMSWHLLLLHDPQGGWCKADVLSVQLAKAVEGDSSIRQGSLLCVCVCVHGKGDVWYLFVFLCMTLSSTQGWLSRVWADRLNAVIPAWFNAVWFLAGRRGCQSWREPCAVYRWFAVVC